MKNYSAEKATNTHWYKLNKKLGKAVRPARKAMHFAVAKVLFISVILCLKR